MRVLFWYCDTFDWKPAIKTLPEAPEADPDGCRNSIVAFIHVEPRDFSPDSTAETKLVKNAKWLARKWETKNILLHSFTHLGEEKAPPDLALKLMENAGKRLTSAGYTASSTPYGYFLDLQINAPGHPLARVYKEF